MIKLVNDKPRFLISSLIVGMIYLLLIYRCFSLGMHKDPAMWAIDAMPAALSKIFYNHNINYTTITEVKAKFYEILNNEGNNPNRLNATIKKLHLSRINGTDYEILGNDDKGIVDFVYIAFKMYGTKSESILYLYLTLLAFSCTTFVIAFRGSLIHIFVLATFLTMFYLVLPSIKYNPQLTSIIALRVFPLFSIIACLHCLCFLIEKTSLEFNKNMRFQLLLATSQIGLICFTIHIRTTAIWQIYILFITATILLFRSLYLSYFCKNNIKIIKHTITTIIVFVSILITSYGSLTIYRLLAFPKEYHKGKQILTRVF